MFRFIGMLLLVLAIGAGALMASGYRFHPENVSYYMNLWSDSALHEVTFTNGQVMMGIIESETEDSIRFNIEDAVTEYSKASIKSIKSQTADNPLVNFINNAQRQSKIHPLMTYDKEKTFKTSVDRFMEDPSRIAEDIKKKNPGISQTTELEKQMRANAQARLNDYQARAKEAAEGG